MHTTETTTPQPRDVIRARRYGNGTFGNYVIERSVREQVDPTGATFSAYAHREHGAQGPRGKRDEFMTFDAYTMRVIRSYR